MKSNTLRYHKSRPLTRARDASDTPMAATIEALNTYMIGMQVGTQEKVAPEREAIEFYLWNHILAVVGSQFELDEPLPEPVVTLVEEAHAKNNEIVARLFWYLLMITTRESRHQKSAVKYNVVRNRWGTEVADFLRSVKHSVDVVQKLRTWEFTETTVGQYLSAVEYILDKGSYSSSFGGKLWGKIARIARKWVTGEISAELMADVGWSLEHNTSSIFNKGMLYQNYSGAKMKTVLDLQRAGMIPNLVWEYAKDGSDTVGFVTPAMAETLANATIILGEFASHIDWYVVEALGSVLHYNNQKQVQLGKYGVSPAYEKMESAAAQALKVQAEMAKAAAMKEAKLYFHVMPGVKVKKTEVVREKH